MNRLSFQVKSANIKMWILLKWLIERLPEAFISNFHMSFLIIIFGQICLLSVHLYVSYGSFHFIIIETIPKSRYFLFRVFFSGYWESYRALGEFLELKTIRIFVICRIETLESKQLQTIGTKLIMNLVWIQWEALLRLTCHLQKSSSNQEPCRQSQFVSEKIFVREKWIRSMSAFGQKWRTKHVADFITCRGKRNQGCN